MVVEQEVAEGVDALDGVWVGEVGGEESRVVGGEEGEGGFVCPELFFVHKSIISLGYERIGWNTGKRTKKKRGKGEKTYAIFPIGIKFCTSMPLLVPITRQRFVRRVLPVVKDLVDDLGDLRRLSRFLEGAVEVGIGDFALGDGDAGVLEEDVDEGEDVGGKVVEDEENGRGDDGDPEHGA